LIHSNSRNSSPNDGNGSSSGEGSLVVRFGILQLNDGNSTILGGHVPHWQGLWKKAKEKIQREKGHGVDPTIKALIWNPLTGGEEGEWLMISILLVGFVLFLLMVASYLTPFLVNFYLRYFR